MKRGDQIRQYLSNLSDEELAEDWDFMYLTCRANHRYDQQCKYPGNYEKNIASDCGKCKAEFLKEEVGTRGECTMNEHLFEEEQNEHYERRISTSRD